VLGVGCAQRGNVEAPPPQGAVAAAQERRRRLWRQWLLLVLAAAMGGGGCRECCRVAGNMLGVCQAPSKGDAVWGRVAILWRHPARGCRERSRRLRRRRLLLMLAATSGGSGCNLRRSAATPFLSVCWALSGCEALCEGGRCTGEQRHLTYSSAPRGTRAERRPRRPPVVRGTRSPSLVRAKGVRGAVEQQHPVRGCARRRRAAAGGVERRHPVLGCARRR
jgi:hypothetical protein